MSFKEPKFKTLFATQIHPIEATDETRNEAKASLRQLRNLLPPEINPEDEPALLFVAGNLAVGGLINLNDDGIDIETALAVYKKFERQQINVEHDRKAVVGYIVHAGLSEFGTDKIITEEEARAANKPFNISVIIAFWRTVARELCDYIESSAAPTSTQENELSLSFEVGFEGYYVAVLPKETPVIASASMTVHPDNEAFSRYSGALRAYRGSGMDPDDANKHVYRIVNKEVTPLGGGVVTVPAAFVKGLTAIVKKPEPVEAEEPKEVGEVEDPAHEAQEKEAEAVLKALEEARSIVFAFITEMDKKASAFIKTPKTGVSSITAINLSNMKLDIQSLKERLSKVTKIEDLNEVVASVSPVIDAIVAESERQEQVRKEAEAHTAKIEAAKAEALANATKLSAELEVVKAELAQIKAAQDAAAAEQAFNTRMSTIDEVFELADDERAEIVADVKGLSDEAFAKWLDKSKKLMKEKMKSEKAKKAGEAKAAQDAIIAKFTEKGVKVKVTDTGFDVEEIIASAQGNPISAPAGTVVRPTSNDLASLAKAAMSTMTIGGKKIDQIK